MAGLHNSPLFVVPYDQKKFDFVSPVCDALNVKNLVDIHKTTKHISIRKRENDSKTILHKRYYDNIEKTTFKQTYNRFIREFIRPLVDEPIYVQKIPTFRIQLPGNLAVGEYHRDDDYGHQQAAINFWIPLMNSHDSNTIQIVLGSDNIPQSIAVKLGECMIFDGVGLLHGNNINTTEETRVSFDFRVIPKANYINSDTKSINNITPLNLMGYYTDLEPV